MVGIPSAIPSDTKYLSVLGTPSSGLSSVSQLQRSHFSNMKNLLELYITYSDISTIDEDTFQDLSSIRQITLPNNKIKTIHKGLFQNLPALAYIDLSGNWDCVVEVGGLSGLPSLQYLYVGNMNLGSLDPGTFQRLPSLKGLYMPGNKLTDIDKDILLPLTGLEVLNIMENDIVSLSQDLEPLFSNLKSSFISDNPWQCTCESKWMKSLSNVASAQVDSIVICLGPDRFKYQNLNTIPDSELQCTPPNITCGGPFTVNVGESLKIECQVEGDPVPTIIFTNPAQVNIAEDTPVLGYELRDNFTIVIHAAVEVEDGNWTVSATNKEGVDMETVHVTVIPPTTTTTTTTTAATTTTATTGTTTTSATTTTTTAATTTTTTAATTTTTTAGTTTTAATTTTTTAGTTTTTAGTTTTSTTTHDSGISVNHVQAATVDNTGLIIGAVAAAITIIAAVTIFSCAMHKKYLKNRVEPFEEDEEDLFGVTVHRIEGHTAPTSTAWI
ncbi:leucine-rich repeat-containing protein 4-like [Haliotis cracherodii]|uniref:leucine-rich repeat-containing protein 4-like n=1 Tax=Haliotis cracherodii TaxID=6455 RepID=UPI0039E7D58F